MGIERNTKLVLAWHLGQRDTVHTEAFTEKLDYATQGRFQLTTDGFRPYENAVSYSLGTRVDYAMLIKVYANNREDAQKYSPPEVVETITKVMIGNPEPSRICTSIVERGNLSMRTSIRRLTRLTNAFSKKWENLSAMLALYFAHALVKEDAGWKCWTFNEEKLGFQIIIVVLLTKRLSCTIWRKAELPTH